MVMPDQGSSGYGKRFLAVLQNIDTGKHLRDADTGTGDLGIIGGELRVHLAVLRFQLLTLPLWGYITMCNMFTQAIGYGVRSTIISTARQGIFLIPALLVFPNIWGLLGIQIAQPVADICTLVLCIAIVNGILRQLKAKEDLA